MYACGMAVLAAALAGMGKVVALFRRTTLHALRERGVLWKIDDHRKAMNKRPASGHGPRTGEGELRQFRRPVKTLLDAIVEWLASSAAHECVSPRIAKVPAARKGKLIQCIGTIAYRRANCCFRRLRSPAGLFGEGPTEIFCRSIAAIRRQSEQAHYTVGERPPA